MKEILCNINYQISPPLSVDEQIMLQNLNAYILQRTNIIKRQVVKEVCVNLRQCRVLER